MEKENIKQNSKVVRLPNKTKQKINKAELKNFETIRIINIDYITIPQMLYTGAMFMPIAEEKKISNEIVSIHPITKYNIFVANPILNQTHINIIDAIFYNAIENILKINRDSFNFLIAFMFGIDYEFNDDNSLKVIFPLNDILDMLKISESQFYRKIEEIKNVKFKILFQMMNDIAPYPNTPMSLITDIADCDIHRLKKREQSAHLTITFSPFFIFLMENYYSTIFPKTLIPKVLDLKYPINQAIARYCIGKNGVNDDMEKILLKLCETCPVCYKKSYKNYSSQYFPMIEEEKDKLFEYFSIEITKKGKIEKSVIKAIKNNNIDIHTPGE